VISVAPQGYPINFNGVKNRSADYRVGGGYSQAIHGKIPAIAMRTLTEAMKHRAIS